MNKKLAKKNSNSKIRKTLMINTVGILAILFLTDPEESYTFLFYFFNALFVALNIFLIVFIDRLSRKVNFVVLLLASAIASFTAYDYYIHGSKTVYIFWISFSIIYIGLALFKELPKMKEAD